MKFLQISLGLFMSLIALTSLLIALWGMIYKAAASPFEQQHLSAAMLYIHSHEQSTGNLPSSSEFAEWGKSMDSKGDFRFEGYGYSLVKNCSAKPSEFCIQFGNGDVFLNYRSWQTDMSELDIVNSFQDNWRLLLFSLGLTAVAGLLLNPRWFVAARAFF